MKDTPPANSSISQCKALVQREFGRDLPSIGLVLGSGFREVLDSVEVKAALPFGALPGFPELAVKGHPAQLILGSIAGLTIIICAGRAHFYEGHSMEAVTFPIDLLAECSVRELLLTNAAGGINRAYKPGDFMLFSDHINMIGVNPLRGRPVADGKSFVDLSDTYCARLCAELKAAAKRARLRLREGVYLGVSGPSYETPAEIRAFRRLGADAVGMSTIPEVLVARYHGIEVAALSCITNFASGLREQKLSHQEVLEAGRRNAAEAALLLSSFASSRTCPNKPGKPFEKEPGTVRFRTKSD